MPDRMPTTRRPRAATALPIDSPRRRRLPPLLRRAWYGMNQAFRRRIAHLGLTPDQFAVLRTLLENDGITQRELADLMSSDPNTVASLSQRMEQAGWVERQAHGRDRRAICLRLKPAGKRKYDGARGVAVALQMEILDALSGEQRERFLELLEAIAAACRKALKKSPTKAGRTRL
jgi:DNA-binding MarR family transcriptional regulator